MNTLTAPHLLPAPELAAPLAVLALASIHALLDNIGKAAMNAVTIAKSAFCAAALSLAGVLLAGHFELVLATFGGLRLSFEMNLLSVSLFVIACLASLLIAKGTVVHEVAAPLKDSIARWNIALLFTACAMILSGSLALAAGGCVIAGAGFFKAQAIIPGVLQGLTSSRMKTMA